MRAKIWSVIKGVGVVGAGVIYVVAFIAEVFGTISDLS